MHHLRMRVQIKNSWPLPALVTWGTAWGLYALLLPHWPWWACVLAAGGLGCVASWMGQSWWRRCMIAAGFPLSWLVLAAGQIPAWGWLLPLGLLLLVYPLNAWRDAPVFPTPAGALDGLAQHLALPDNAKLLDAGCGMGDGLQALHRAWPQAKVHGVEWSWPLRWVSQLRCPWAKVRRGDMWLADWSQYDLVYLFQRPETMSRAAVKSLGEMRDGAWLVSLNFPIPDATPTYIDQLDDGREVYAYRAPLAEVDRESVEADEVAGMLEPAPQGFVVNGQSLYPRKGRPGGTPKHH